MLRCGVVLGSLCSPLGMVKAEGVGDRAGQGRVKAWKAGGMMMSLQMFSPTRRHHGVPQ